MLKDFQMQMHQEQVVNHVNCCCCGGGSGGFWFCPLQTLHTFDSKEVVNLAPPTPAHGNRTVSRWQLMLQIRLIIAGYFFATDAMFIDIVYYEMLQRPWRCVSARVEEFVDLGILKTKQCHELTRTPTPAPDAFADLHGQDKKQASSLCWRSPWKALIRDPQERDLPKILQRPTTLSYWSTW